MYKPITILLADDHPLLTAGLRMTIENWEEFSVVGTASDGREVVAMCQRLSPDIIIMDMQMPHLSGPEAIRKIRETNSSVRILALTTFDDSETVTRALEAGCEGFLLKVIPPEKLRAVLLSISDGMHVYDETIMAQYRKSLRKRMAPEFSARELEILGYICQGLTNAEIADKVHLRTGTVKNIVSALLSKTNSLSRAGLVSYASEHRLL